MRPRPRIEDRARAGAFRGFDGQFLSPPRVRAVFAGGLVATDGDGTWRLHADIYNAILQRCEPPQPHPPPLPTQELLTAKGATRRSHPTAQSRGKASSERFPELAHPPPVSRPCSHTLAVTIPTSHHLFLVALA